MHEDNAVSHCMILISTHSKVSDMLRVNFSISPIYETY